MKDHEIRIMPEKELQHLISSVIIIENKYPESVDIYPFAFCPKCGCTKIFQKDGPKVFVKDVVLK